MWSYFRCETKSPPVTIERNRLRERKLKINILGIKYLRREFKGNLINTPSVS